MTTAWPSAVLLLEKKKQQQTDPHGEDKKKEQHQLPMDIRNGYILVWNTNVSRIEHAP